MRFDDVADPAPHDQRANGRQQPATRAAEAAEAELPEVPPELDGARCVICGLPSTTSPSDPVPESTTWSESSGLPERLPPAHLCDEHWSKYRSDWLLLGWCVDHYGEALRYCTIHGQEIQPL